MNDKIKRELKKAINKIIREKGRFPTLLEMCGILGYSETQTQNYMEALAEEGYVVEVGDWFKFPETVNLDRAVAIKGDYGEPIGAYLKRFHNSCEPSASCGPEDIPNDILEQKMINVFNDGAEVSCSYESEEEIVPDIILNKSIVPKTRKPRKKKESEFQEEATLYGMPVYVIQFVMGIVGVGAAIISVYYTTIWLVEFLPWAFALLLSGIMIGFSVAAFETVILFLSGTITKSKVAKISVSVGFIILWLIVSAFSIVSTIAGQVDQYSKNIQEEAKKKSNISGVSWNLMQEHKNDIKIRISEYRQQIKSYNKISAGMDNLDSRTANERVWSENQWRLKKAQESVEKLSDEIDKIRKEEQALLEKNKDSGIILDSNKNIKNDLNFYEWLSKVLNIREDFIQFWLSLFPAVFVDLIAPTAIAISLFLRKRKL